MAVWAGTGLSAGAGRLRGDCRALSQTFPINRSSTRNNRFLFSSSLPSAVSDRVV